ncbi:hypothetical protein LXA43DRAFT_972420 [Ganoderma leucocontextum]|nr:hypothetical protein LXA43DRAFT_972420 [Ganoderma leucocontextum]
MARIFATAGLFAYVAFAASMLANGAPARRQLGNLECNIDRAEIVFHVAQFAGIVNTLGNNTHLVAANKTVKHDVMTLQTGAQGAGGAIKQIVLALVNGDKADPNLRTQVGGNLTAIRDALADLSSKDNSTSALLDTANTEFVNSVNAANGVVNNCK